jgi:enamine deaminase RidA (YjgF/YER057c/UK114 family)
MDHYDILRSGPGVSFAETLLSLRIQMENYLEMEAAQGRRAVFVRFFLSDAQNQVEALRAMLKSFSWTGRREEQALEDIPAISIVEQPPLDRSGIAVLVHTSSERRDYLFHSLRLTEDEARGLDSYSQARLLFDKYLDIIRPLGLDLKTHCVRTWIYVRDIDANYAGLVRARNDVFAREGLSHDTHYIASTGIGGATEGRSAVVAIDFLTRPDIRESDKTYLKALSHLSPTHDYGVAFERGVRLSDGRIYISGTASIDRRGQVLHEGNVLAQADRLLENIDCLLREGGSSLEKVPYFIVYLRDISDYPLVDAYMQRRFHYLPRVILEARVCRPTWLIEMECEVAP